MGDDFESIFGSDPDVAYSQKDIDTVIKTRRQLESQLYFDRLLNAIGVDQGKIRVIASLCELR